MGLKFKNHCLIYLVDHKSIHNRHDINAKAWRSRMYQKPPVPDHTPRCRERRSVGWSMGMRKNSSSFPTEVKIVPSVQHSFVVHYWDDGHSDEIRYLRDETASSADVSVAWLCQKLLDPCKDRSTLHDHRNNKITYHKDSGLGMAMMGADWWVLPILPKHQQKANLKNGPQEEAITILMEKSWLC